MSGWHHESLLSEIGSLILFRSNSLQLAAVDSTKPLGKYPAACGEDGLLLKSLRVEFHEVRFDEIDDILKA
jgi:hypothetical protein